MLSYESWGNNFGKLFYIGRLLVAAWWKDGLCTDYYYYYYYYYYTYNAKFWKQLLRGEGRGVFYLWERWV